MWQGSLAVLFGLCAIAAGCSGPEKPGKPPTPVLMQTYNAQTNEPLGSVSVTRWDWEYGRGDQTVFSTPAGETGRIDGLIQAAIGESPPSFIFSKDGFEPAEVRV